MRPRLAQGAGSLMLVISGVLALHGKRDVDLLAAVALGAAGLVLATRDEPKPD